MAREKQRPGEGFHKPFAALAGIRLPDKARPAAPAPPPARRAPPESDEELFLAEVGGVKPFEGHSGRVGAPPPDARGGLNRAGDDAEVLAQLADLCDGAGAFDVADTDEYIEGIAEGIDRRLLRRLRAGDYAVQAHIDLHGLTREEAHEKVSRFIAASRRSSRRCVLIVHGRGHHSKDQIPVLKQAVKTWLERGHTARSVLAFATARPCDGGAGAVYVLLRR